MARNLIVADAPITFGLLQTSEVCENSGFLCREVYEWTNSELAATAVAWLIGKPLGIIIVLAVASVASRAVRKLIRRVAARMGKAAAHDSTFTSSQASDRAEQRAASISALSRSASSAVIYTIAFVVILQILGVSVVPLVASAGFAGIALGFGAQRLVEDVITGLFMLVEDQFGVGDRIDAGMVNGTVEALTIRSTVVRDPDGMLWHLPNSEIRRVANESQHWARAKVDIGVSYNAPLAEAMDVLHTAALEQAERSEWSDDVLGAPEVIGVQELGLDSVNIRVTTRVVPEARRQYERDLRRTLVEAIEDASIEMPNRQVDVWIRDQPGTAS